LIPAQGRVVKVKPSESAESDAIEDLPFETTSDVETTRRDVAYRLLDQFVLAPGRVILNDWRGVIGLTIILIYILIGTVGVWIVPPPSSDDTLGMVGIFTGLDWKLMFGTNPAGEGILPLMFHATPSMLKMMLAGGVFGTGLGAAIGMIAGYKGGRIESALMLCTDTMMTIPGLPLVIVLTFIFNPQNPYLIGILIVLPFWTGLARAIRSQMLTLREIEYVESNRLMGISTGAILTKDILPNLAPYIAVNFVFISRTVVFNTTALYYLGVLNFGSHWGQTLNSAFRGGAVISGMQAMHWLLGPVVAIVGLALGTILLSQALDRLFNPRIRARHQKTTTTGDDEVAEESTTTTTTP
jgi:peptide/nickel transport system permease protein